ncbi:MAG: protein-L-isoaspartate(D-aspartate) O-methyltransferase [Planctomycetaceae bacterium]|nr:protein-L-isoaspartate(D-aspartate) O-methyltransferase [Planctomycetaceae bacterium]
MMSESALLSAPRGRTAWICAVLIVASTIAGLGSSACCRGQDRFESLRHRMVAEAIEAEGITNPAVIAAMKKVPRHEFVPSGLRNQAYADSALPIGSQQTISPPYVVAYMTEVLEPQESDKVLEIGTGSGYQAAVLSEIVSEVYTIEIVPALAKNAAKRLAELKYRNVFPKEGDGYQGWEEHAPFDKIIVTCSPESIPRPLTEQLKEGGRMIIPVGERYQQSFVLLQKVDGELKQEKLISTLFVPMTGQSEDERKVQPDPNHPEIVNGSFEIDQNEDGRADGWHYLRRAELCQEDPMHGRNCLRFDNDIPGELAQGLQGTAINGRQIAGLQLQYWVRYDNVQPGSRAHEQAAVVFHFYDGIRREVGTVAVGRWRGSLDWHQAHSTIQVPPQAKEMIIRLGLNGATGQLDFDDLQMVLIPR